MIRDKTTGTGSGSAGAGTLRGFIDDTLAGLSISPSATASTTSSSSSSSGGSAGEADRGKRKETVAKLQNMKNLINIEGTNPSYRKKVMDIHYLCDEAPLKVPATPWTTLTNDDDLVSHLVALYLAWDYPVHGFLDPETLIKCMNLRERGKGDLCTEFLVNCLLAVACVCPFPFPVLLFSSGDVCGGVDRGSITPNSAKPTSSPEILHPKEQISCSKQRNSDPVRGQVWLLFRELCFYMNGPPLPPCQVRASY